MTVALVCVGRCIHAWRLPSNYTIGKDNDEKQLDDIKHFLVKLAHLANSSHYKGTCLLTGVQPTVDITSNPRTSTIPFSSVNPLFMACIVMWVTASFALFHLADASKDGNDGNAAQYDKGDTLHWWAFEDGCMGVAIAWNTLGIICLTVQSFRTMHSIPLNNAVLGIVALLASILVQWSWANFHMFDIELHERASQVAMGFPAKEGVDEAGPPDKPLPVPIGSDPSIVEPSNEENPVDPTAAAISSGRGYLMFNTSNFLSTASAFASNNVPVLDNGLRKRSNATHARGQYAPLINRRMTRREQLQLRPNYRNMLVTGTPIARKHYRLIIQVHARATAT